MPIITFSINKNQEEFLKTYVENNESLNLTAKRLLLEMLESYELTDNARNPNWEERLTSLESTVQDLAKVLSELTNKDEFFLEAPQPLEEMLSKFPEGRTANDAKEFVRRVIADNRVQPEKKTKKETAEAFS
ncbi:hypothetical protein [Aphanothece sacrum]|uniref:HrcA family transcriptional regulator n=1 Tax=Aphanothece sacrum FPU1 TaxID=1920663 RepID=A0A401IEF0_APHSA|nr:hypothetical protein [Aphanothece sacrum]GBF79589.1 HrcA family transcriptional regulator [Aphanothece sacrum FPU1]GBF87048.1 HrcA family transcriptional regulator [Aphanothece sacrum FPU3]